MKKLPEKMPLTNIVNIPEVVEVCSNCMNEVHIFWNNAEDGYKAFCPYCGERLMLCDECRHSEEDEHGNACGVCDYDSETDTCKYNRKGEPEMKALNTDTLMIFNRLSEVRFRQMCIDHNLCNICDTKSYIKLLNAVDNYGEYTGLTEKLIMIARLTLRYTYERDENDKEQVSDMIMLMLNEALVWSYSF